MTSPYLNLPPRSLMQAEADQYMRRLEAIAGDFRMNALRLDNSPDNRDVVYASELRERAYAVDWALEQLSKAQYEKDMAAEIMK